MKKKILRLKDLSKEIILHPLFSGSAMLVSGASFANFLAYLYHLIFGRLMEPSEYGGLSAAISLLGLLSVSFSFFSTVIVKFISAARENEIKGILFWFIKKASVLSFTFGAILFAVSGFVGNFLHLDQRVVILIGLILIFTVFSLILRSTLHGLLKFKEVVIVTNTEMLGRLILGLVFVLLGYSIFGAFIGILLSVLISLALTLFYIRQFKFWELDSNFNKGKEILSYAIPIFFSSIASNSFFSTDVILVKHFFDSHDAGIYAALSTLGKIIFFGAGPVSSVMFPMISKRHASGKGYKKIFSLSIFLTLLIAGGVLLIYLFIPKLTIEVLYGSKYIEAAPYLFLFGVFMTIFTLDSLILNYFLSKNVTRVSYLAVIFAAIQGVGIWFFHERITTVIKISILASSLFFISLLLYFGYESKKNQ